jgi:hypothetical protein
MAKQETVYTKIWNALELAVKANTGVTFNAHEALELLGVLESYKESIALLKGDYQQTINALRTRTARLEEILTYFGVNEVTCTNNNETRDQPCAKRK